jgi:hypothetical protein
MTEACLLTPLDQFFLSVLYRFSAYGAFCIFKELHLTAPFVLACDHQRLTACVAFRGGGERLSVAERTYCRKRSAASGTQCFTALNIFQTFRAAEPERARTSAVITKTTIPLYELAAMDARLLVCGHTSLLLVAVTGPLSFLTCLKSAEGRIM